MATPAAGRRSMFLDQVAVHENNGGLVLESTVKGEDFIVYVSKKTAAYRVLHELLVRHGRDVS